MIFLASQLLFIIFGLAGLIVWAYSDMPLVMREIAINTRRNSDQGSSYILMKVLSVCLKIVAVFLWFAGIASIIALNAGCTSLGNLFHGIGAP
ncbi:MAG TPA: hypothetical protein VMU36_10160 [Spirochaetia bacterium]|nr:hypothetical protein [Spirochaetia bacterium]